MNRNGTLSLKTCAVLIAVLSLSGLTASAAAGPDVAVSVTNGLTDIQPGASLIYTVTLTNGGDQIASNVTPHLTIPLPVSLLSISDSGSVASTGTSLSADWPAFSLTAGSTVLRQIKVQLNSLPAGFSKTAISTATVTATGDINTANNTASTTNTVIANPDMNVTISDGLTNISAGSSMTYTIVAGNAGSVGTTGVKIAVNIPTNTVLDTTSITSSIPSTHTFAGNVLTFNVTAIGDGFSGTANFTFKLTLPNPLPAGTTSTLSVAATISDDGANGADSIPSNNMASDVDTISGVAASNVDLSVQITDGLTAINPGATMLYTLIVNNLGNGDATGVLVQANIPANTTVVAGSISNGGSVSGNFVVFPKFALAHGAQVLRQFTLALGNPLPSPAPTNLSVTGTVSGDQAESNTANNSATDCDKIVIPPREDLAIDQCNGISCCVNAGQNLKYVLTISNVGNVNSTGVLVKDTIPPGSTFVSASDGGPYSNGVVTFPTFSLAAGASVFRTVTVNITSPVPANVPKVCNTATVTDDGSNGPDLCICNNSTTLCNPYCPDLAIKKTLPVSCVLPGATLTYTLTATSLTPTDTTGVIVKDTIPPLTTYSSSSGGTFAGGVVTFPAFNLAGLGTATFTVTVIMTNSIPNGTVSIDNIATITDDGTHGPDSNTTNNTYKLTTPVCTAPDVAVVKSLQPGKTCVSAPDTLVYTITASTLNSVAVTGVLVKDTIPANTTFVSASDGGTFAGGVVTFPTFPLNGNSSVTRTVTLSVSAPIPNGVVNFANTVTVTDDGTHGTDINLLNNTFTLNTPVCTTAPDVAVVKSLQPGKTCVSAPDTLIYTITASTLNSVAVTGVLVKDTIPANTTFVSASDGGTFAGGVVTFPTFPLNGNSSVTRTVTLSVSAPIPNGVVNFANTVTVTDDGTHGTDTNLLNNTFTLNTPVCSTAPDLAVVKTLPPDKNCVHADDTITYTITGSTVTNVAVTGVLIKDTIPTNTTFVSASDGGTFAGGVVTFPTFPLNGLSSVIRMVTVHVNTPLPGAVVSISNTVTITDDGTHGADTNLLNNTFTLTTPICNGGPDLRVIKTLQPPCVTTSAILPYTITVSDVGTVPATGVVVTDTIPANTTFISASDGGTFAGGVVTFPAFNLAGNASVTRTVTVQAAANLAGVANIANTVNVHDDGSHGPVQDITKTTYTLMTPVCSAPDLMITQDSAPGCFNPGDQIIYTLAVKNIPGFAVTGVVIKDTIPAHTTFVSASNGGTFAAGVVTFPAFDLDANTTAIRTVTVALDNPLGANITLTNTATVTDDGSKGPDSNTANNSAVRTDCVTCTAPIIQSASATPVPVVAGQPETFTVVAVDPNSLPLTVTWDFGDGSTGVGATVQHTYAAAGIYTVKATVSNGFCAVGTTLQPQTVLPVQVPATCQLLRARLNLTKQNADSLTVLAQVNLPPGLKLGGQQIEFTVNGFDYKAILNSKGTFHDALHTVAVKAKGSFSIIALKVTKSTLAPLLVPATPPGALTTTVPTFFGVVLGPPGAGQPDSFGQKLNLNYKSNGKTAVLGF